MDNQTKSEKVTRHELEGICSGMMVAKHLWPSPLSVETCLRWMTIIDFFAYISRSRKILGRQWNAGTRDYLFAEGSGSCAFYLLTYFKKLEEHFRLFRSMAFFEGEGDIEPGVGTVSKKWWINFILIRIVFIRTNDRATWADYCGNCWRLEEYGLTKFYCISVHPFGR